MGGAVSHPGALQRAVQPPDAELLAHVAAGDLSDLGVLFDRHALHVRRFLGLLGVGAGDVDDLVQATFLTVLDAAGTFRGAGSARAWLLGLAANVARRHRRSLMRMAARIAAWAREPHPDSEATASDSLDVRERSARAARALARLTAKKREVFVMVVMEGLPAEAVAQALDVPVGTVWTRLHHARRELRAAVDQEDP
jgi:RNA polymerase sigma-70 factor (ECF subfamily)